MVNPKVVEIVNLVNSLTSIEEVRQVNDMVVAKIKAVQALRNQMSQFNFEVGDSVQWESNRRGYGIRCGKVLKKNRTRAVVLTEAGQSWNVPFYMLEKVETDG